MKNKKKRVQKIGVGGLILSNDNEILLVQRNEPNHKIYDGKWCIPGGHLEFGDDPKERLTKKMKEELNIEIEITQDKPYIASLLFDMKKVIYHGLFLGYSCHIIKGEPKINNEENRNFKWVKPGKISFRYCIPPTQIFIRQFLKSRQQVSHQAVKKLNNFGQY